MDEHLKPLDLAHPPEQWAEIERRIPASFPPEPPRHGARIAAAAVGLAIAVAASAFLVWSFAPEERTGTADQGSPTPSAPSPTPSREPLSALPGSGSLVIATGDRLVALDGGASAVRQLPVPPSFDGCCGISVSPDGSRVVYGTAASGGQGELEIADLGTGEPAFTTGPQGLVPAATWSPDGTAVLFSYGGGIEVYSLHGRALSAISTPPEGCVDSFPTWSGATAQIAFFRDCRAGGQTGIYVQPSTASPPTKVSGAPSDLGNPVVPRGLAWSPDGTRLALEAADGSLWLIDPEGTNAVELAPPASEEIPGFGTVSWSPDGAYLACVRDGGVALVDLATGVVRALDPTLDLEPTSIWWSSSPVPS